MSEREAKLEQALREMVKLFDMDNRRVHKIEDKWWAVVPAADAERAYNQAVGALAPDGLPKHGVPNAYGGLEL